MPPMPLNSSSTRSGRPEEEAIGDDDGGWQGAIASQLVIEVTLGYAKHIVLLLVRESGSLLGDYYCLFVCLLRVCRTTAIRRLLLVLTEIKGHTQKPGSGVGKVNN